MRRADVKATFAEYKRGGRLVSPSSFAGGGVVTLQSRIDVWFALDKDYRVAMLGTTDKRVAIHRGLGPGSTYGNLITTVPELEVTKLCGYGVMVTAPELETDELILFFCFDFEESLPLRADARVRWIEVRRAGRIDWLYGFD